MHIGEHIKKERERLGFNQADFAALAGATRKTLFNWESGASAPDANQLAALAAAGVDVLYVLTGLAADAHLRLALLDKSMSIASEQADTFTEVKSLGTEMRNTMLRHTATTDDECEMLALYRKASKDVKTAALGALRAGTET